MVAGDEECGAGAGEDLEEEKGDNTRMNNDDDRQHTTIKQNTVEVGGRRRRWHQRSPQPENWGRRRRNARQ
jgi:hypothetical protein